MTTTDSSPDTTKATKQAPCFYAKLHDELFMSELSKAKALAAGKFSCRDLSTTTEYEAAIAEAMKYLKGQPLSQALIDDLSELFFTLFSRLLRIYDIAFS